MGNLLNIYKKHLPSLPKPEPEDFEHTLHNAPYKTKRNQAKKFIQQYQLENIEKDVCYANLTTAFKLIRTSDYTDYESSLHLAHHVFNLKFNFNISLNEYEAHLVHLFRLSLDKF